MFDSQYDPLQRLAAISAKQKKYPGRRLGGTGETGLLSNDAQGWSDMLNEQTEAANLQNELGGKGPLQVRSGGLVGPSNMGESLGDTPEWWLQGHAAGTGPQTVEGALNSTPQRQRTVEAMKALRKMVRTNG